MKPVEALQQMVRQSGKSQRLISEEIGRTPTYVSSLLHDGSNPQIDTFVTIAKACGCKVIVEFPKHKVELDGWGEATIQTREYLG